MEHLWKGAHCGKKSHIGSSMSVEMQESVMLKATVTGNKEGM